MIIFPISSRYFPIIIDSFQSQLICNKPFKRNRCTAPEIHGQCQSFSAVLDLLQNVSVETLDFSDSFTKVVSVFMASKNQGVHRAKNSRDSCLDQFGLVCELFVNLDEFARLCGVVSEVNMMHVVCARGQEPGRDLRKGQSSGHRDNEKNTKRGNKVKHFIVLILKVHPF